jgi:hypothetical protein
MFSSSRCNVVVPGIGAQSTFLCQQPGQRDLVRCGVFLPSHSLQQIDERVIRLAILGIEPRDRREDPSTQ